MNYLLLALVPLFAETQDLNPSSLEMIGQKIWQNECRGTLDGLIHWNANEPFPSLGIGHFIWYPEGVDKQFEETFPNLIDFIAERTKDTDLQIPAWLKTKKGFPWKSREAFLQDLRSKKMVQLRTFLSSTLDHQMAFLLERLNIAEQELLPLLSSGQKRVLGRLKKTPNGVYALIDYVNFKGIGINPKERYLGQGWGLLQVLQQLDEKTPDADLVEAFCQSAKKVLATRVKNAPSQKQEERWLKGWHNRIETYKR